MASLKSFLSILLLLAFASASATASRPMIQMFSGKKLQGSDDDTDRKCESWKFSFEADNLRSQTFPRECFRFVFNYVIGRGGNSRYLDDLLFVANSASEFANTITLKNDGKDAWIFDIDETSLSNFLYFVQHPHRWESFDEIDLSTWLEQVTITTPIISSLNLYLELQGLGFKIILLTGRNESARNNTEFTLRRNGYSDWEKLIMRGPKDQGKDAIVYKSGKRAELVQEGYRLHGNVGDQWSDLLGSPLATRSFKLPNPIYYIP